MPSSLAVLRDFMLQRYDDLKARLTRRLGCADMASDALQDTWLRLEGKDELGPVDSPGAYLLRMAVNVAVDQQRAENRRLTSSEAEALLALPTPRPVRRRRRKAARNWTRWCGSWASCPSVSAGCCWPCGWKRLPQAEVATRMGVSLRTVERELRSAHEHCATRVRNLLSP